ncbi:hypothetical protein [Sediminibacterium sp.]|jgi:hypothetical protein|uniref:hypothetical protein n=1 Tax=Sediminibacterium sp. TaxID=1917865 RepID=UPI003F705396
MKKIVLGAILAISAFSTSFASSSQLVSNEEPNSKKVATSKSLQFHVPNKNQSKLKVENCATRSSTIEGTCWMLIATSTVCCECETPVAAMLATMNAQDEARRLAWIIEVLEEIDPC